MKHFVQVERLATGEQRDDPVHSETANHRDKEDLFGVDRELDGIHLPDHPRVERAGDGLKEPSDGVDPSFAVKPRIDNSSPVALDSNAADGDKCTGEE